VVHAHRNRWYKKKRTPLAAKQRVHPASTPALGTGRLAPAAGMSNWIHPNNGGTRAVRPCNFAWSSVRAETSGFNGTIITGVTPIKRAW